MIAVHHCTQLVHSSTKNTILSSKTSPDRFQTEIFSWLFEHVFTLKSLLERLKRDFDGSKIVSFQFTSKLYVSHFNKLFRSSHIFSAENMIPDLLSSKISIYKVSFRSVIAVHHCAQLVHFSTKNTILSSKTSP